MSVEDLKQKIEKAEQDEAFPLQGCFDAYVCNDALPQDRDYYRWIESEQRWRLVPAMPNVIVDTFKSIMQKAPKKSDVTNIELNLGADLRITDLRSPCVIDFATRTAKPVQGWVFARNTVLVPKPDGTLATTPYSRRIFTLTRLPYDYDPAAVCPTIDAWLKDRLGDDDAVRAVWEFVGSCLEPGNRYKTFVIFSGEGNTGKTCAMNLIRAILGEENVSSLPAGYLNVPSVVQAARFKLLNISEEKTKISESAEETIKDWSSGGAVFHNPKYRTPFSEPATAKLLFSMNKMPLFTDSSRAIYNRATIVGWDRIIPPEEAVPLEVMAKRFEPELPGALNRALAAKAQLDARGRVLQPQRSRDTANELYEQSNPFIAWFVQACEYRPNARIPCQEAYDDFRDFCDVAGVRPPPSIIEFGKGLRNLGVVGDQRVHITRKRDREKDPETKQETQVWVYEGFTVVRPSMPRGFSIEPLPQTPRADASGKES